MPFALNPIFIGGGRFFATILSFDFSIVLPPMLPSAFGLKCELPLIELVPAMPVCAEPGRFFSVVAAVPGSGASY